VLRNEVDGVPRGGGEAKQIAIGHKGAKVRREQGPPDQDVIDADEVTFNRGVGPLGPFRSNLFRVVFASLRLTLKRKSSMDSFGFWLLSFWMNAILLQRGA